MSFFSKLFKKKNTAGLIVAAPVDGKVVPSTDVKDETFSQDMIGRGFAVIPSNGDYVSPIKGEITLIAETGHAYSVKSANGVEVLVHIGLDTVNLNNNHTPGTPLKAFTIKAKVGDQVEIGTPIMTVDLDVIKTAGYDTITPVVVIKNDVTAKLNTSVLTVNTSVTKGTTIAEVK